MTGNRNLAVVIRANVQGYTITLVLTYTSAYVFYQFTIHFCQAHIYRETAEDIHSARKVFAQQRESSFLRSLYARKVR